MERKKNSKKWYRYRNELEIINSIERMGSEGWHPRSRYKTCLLTPLYHRLTDGKLIANYRVQAELTAIAGSEDGRTIVLGTVDGCVSTLTIADPTRPGIRDYLADLPSRNLKVSLSLHAVYSEPRADSDCVLCRRCYSVARSGRWHRFCFSCHCHENLF